MAFREEKEGQIDTSLVILVLYLLIRRLGLPRTGRTISRGLILLCLTEQSTRASPNTTTPRHFIARTTRLPSRNGSLDWM